MHGKRALSGTLISVTAFTAFGVTPGTAYGSTPGAPLGDTSSPVLGPASSSTPGTALGPAASPVAGPVIGPVIGPVAGPVIGPVAGRARVRTGISPVIRVKTWTTSARPKMVAMRPASRNKKIALGQVVRRSWNYSEFRCLDNLWTRESNWNHRALNHSSGAYGIPQALPAGKMRGAGRDWRSNPETQIRWGLAYIKGRYGRPCGAWGHWQSHNWY